MSTNTQLPPISPVDAYLAAHIRHVKAHNGTRQLWKHNVQIDPHLSAHRIVDKQFLLDIYLSECQPFVGEQNHDAHKTHNRDCSSAQRLNPKIFQRFWICIEMSKLT